MPKNENFSAYSSRRFTPTKPHTSVTVGLDNVPPSYNLVGRLLGPAGINLEMIRSQTGASLALGGRGSGVLEPATMCELDVPLHIRIENKDKESLQRAREMAVELVKTVREEYFQSKPLSAIPQQGGYPARNDRVSSFGSSDYIEVSQPSTSNQSRFDQSLSSTPLPEHNSLAKFTQGVQEHLHSMSSTSAKKSSHYSPYSLTDRKSRTLQESQEVEVLYDKSKQQLETISLVDDSDQEMNQSFSSGRDSQQGLHQQWHQHMSQAKTGPLSVEDNASLSQRDTVAGDEEESPVSASTTNTDQLYREFDTNLGKLKVIISESLFAAVMYQLFGCFRTVHELTMAGATLHTRTVRYIHQHKDLFYSQIKGLYDQVHPGNTLDGDAAFERGCLYLGEPGNAGDVLLLKAIATLFSTSIVMLQEVNCEGREMVLESEPLVIEPIHDKTASISILKRNSRAKRYDAVLTDVSTLRSAVTANPHNSFVIATWHLESDSGQFTYSKIDKTLAMNKIDFACVQGNFSLPSQRESDNYFWYVNIEDDQFVAFLLHKHSKMTLTDFTVQWKGLISAVVSLGGWTVPVVGCFIPSKYKYDTEFFELINQLLRSHSQSANVFLLGQFEASVDFHKLTRTQGHLVGKMCLYDIPSNENGHHLLALAIEHQLQFLSTLKAPPKGCSPATFRQTGTKKGPKSQISHILFRDNYPYTRPIQNWRVWEPGSRHAIVGCQLGPGHTAYSKTKK